MRGEKPIDPLHTQLTLCLPLFTALGDTHRQKMLQLLMTQGRLNVGQLTDLMPLSRPAVSHHLKIMRDADLVRVEQVGNERFYSMNHDYSETHPCPIQRLRTLVEVLEATLENTPAPVIPHTP